MELETQFLDYVPKFNLKKNNLFIISIGTNEYKKKFHNYSKIKIIEIKKNNTIS